MYSSLAIANQFLRLALDEGRGLTHLQLQKLVYIAHGWYLALKYKPLIEDDVQAWKNGPVIQPLYHNMKHNGDDEIMVLQTPSNLDRAPLIKDDYTKDVIKKIWEEYGHLTAGQLVELTHQKGTPWSRVYDGQLFKVIDNDLIHDYYAELMNNQEYDKAHSTDHL